MRLDNPRADSKLARYDSIVIGAGHNGLVCAAYLARAGQRVLLLESAETAGGLAARRPFHTGFEVSVAHSVGHFPARIHDDLKLATHGFAGSVNPASITGLDKHGNHVSLAGTEVQGVAAADAEALRDFNAAMQRFADALKPFWLKTIPRAAFTGLADLITFAQIGLKLRGLGREDMREFLRIAALPARDLVDERFENEILKAILCWDGLMGSKMAPRSPNSAVLPMLYRLGGDLRGEPAQLISALVKAATAAGVEIRTEATVQRIRVKAAKQGLQAYGVQLTDGEELEAEHIISSADPQATFFRLLGAENLEIEFTNRIRRLRCDGYVAKLHLALDGVPDFTGLGDIPDRLLITPCMDAIEFAFDDAKYGGYCTHPVMEISLPSLVDTDLAPPGRHVLSAHVMYVPYRLKSGWDDASRSALLECCIATIEQYAPAIRSQVLHAEVLTPADLEKIYGVTGGHWHQTEFALDQALMMRPTYGAAQYATPIPGLYLCGAGSHPGGDLTGMPGHNAAHEILRK